MSDWPDCLPILSGLLSGVLWASESGEGDDEMIEEAAAFVRSCATRPFLDSVRGEQSLILTEEGTGRAFDIPNGILTRQTGSGIDDRQAYLMSILLSPRAIGLDSRYVPVGLVRREASDPDSLNMIPHALSDLLRSVEGTSLSRKTFPVSDIVELLRIRKRLILLGSPGAGKSTLLLHVALTLAFSALKDHLRPVPLILELSEQMPNEQISTFLERVWERRGPPGPIPVTDLVGRGDVVVLLDGLNEVSGTEVERRMVEWKLLIAETPETSVVAACRQRDYQIPIGLTEVFLQPLDAERRALLAERLGSRTALQLLLSDPRMARITSNPFSLTVLAYLQRQGGESVVQIGTVLERYVEALMLSALRSLPARERDDSILWIEELAWQLQLAGNLAANRSVTSQSDSRVELLIGTWSIVVDRKAFEAAVSGGCLTSDRTIVRFPHQLVQEALVARRIAREFDAGLPSILRSVVNTSYPASTDPLNLGVWERLPASRSGWEEVVKEAAQLVRSPAEFVEELRKIDPLVAVAASLEVDVSADLKRRMGGSIVPILGSSRPLVDRLAASDALNEVIDPRFRSASALGRYPLVDLELNPARLVGRYLVVVSLYGDFVTQGGYTNEEWWSERGRQWLVEGLIPGGAVDGMLRYRAELRAESGLLEKRAAQHAWGPDTRKLWAELTEMPEGESRELLEARYRRERPTGSAYKDDPVFDRPSLPIVGITLFEAQAFARWLSATLPGQFEVQMRADWTSASAGTQVADSYPWGNLLGLDLANTVETHILRPSAVGMFPSDAGNCGAVDVVGNVREWTQTVDDEGEYHVVGGAWSRSGQLARRSQMNSFAPDFWDYNLGIRLTQTESLQEETVRLVES